LSVTYSRSVVFSGYSVSSTIESGIKHHNPSTYKCKLQMAQRKAARGVTKRQWNTFNISDMLQQTNWYSLEDRCKDA
jgi:hypothetical protein